MSKLLLMSGPYHSAFLGKYLKESQTFVYVDKNVNKNHLPYQDMYNNNTEYFDSLLQHIGENAKNQMRILATLEDTLPFLYEKFPNHPSTNAAKIFKDKYSFREAIKDLYPSFKFKKLEKETMVCHVSHKDAKLPEMTTFDSDIVVIKPIYGIASKDVRIVTKYDSVSIPATKDNPYIIEDYIRGSEYAIDAYIDDIGDPHIINIMCHEFSDIKDTSDVLYFTSKNIVNTHSTEIKLFIYELSKKFNLKSFPFHLEVRKNENGDLIPIELNPLRFAGYGTCEIAQWAHGINPYDAFFDLINTDTLHNRNVDDAFYGFYEILNKDEKALRKQYHDFIFQNFSEVLDYRIINDPKEKVLKGIVFFRETSYKKFMDYRNLSCNT